MGQNAADYSCRLAAFCKWSRICVRVKERAAKLVLGLRTQAAWQAGMSAAPTC